MSDDIETHVLGERKFLHDLSNQLVIAQGMTVLLMKKINGLDSVDQKEKERSEKILNSVEKMIDLLKERKQYLTSRFDS